MPTTFTLQTIVRGIRENLVIENHLHFGLSLETCLWFSATHRHQILRLPKAEFCLVMKFKKNKQFDFKRFIASGQIALPCFKKLVCSDRRTLACFLKTFNCFTLILYNFYSSLGTIARSFFFFPLLSVSYFFYYFLFRSF